MEIRAISQKGPLLNFFTNGAHLVDKLRKKMKTKVLAFMVDAYHLRKRAIIESIFGELKNICQEWNILDIEVLQIT